MHSKGDNIEVMMNNEADEVIKELFDSLKNRYQNNLETRKCSEFVFNYVHLLYYKCHKINPNHGGSYIDSPDWIKNKKATINPINKKYKKCFEYTVTVASDHEEIRKHAERITKIEPFMNKYKWEGRNFHQKKMIGKIFMKIMQQLLLIFFMLKKKKSCLCFKTYLKSSKTSYFFNDSKWRRKTLSCSKKTISIINRNNKLELHKKVCKNKDFCNLIMPSEDAEILEFNQHQKSGKVPFIIYADLRCIIEKTVRCKNNP